MARRRTGSRGKRGMGGGILLLAGAAVVGLALSQKKEEPPPPQATGEIAAGVLFALEPIPATTPQAYRVRASLVAATNTGAQTASYDLWLTGYVDGVEMNTNKNTPSRMTNLAPGGTSDVGSMTTAVGAGPGAVSAILRLVLRGVETVLDAVDSGAIGAI